MKIPGPDHPIAVTAAGRRWRARFNGHVIADSADALVLKESTFPAVIYFPREDVSMSFLGKTARSTNCPYKGDASYYTVTMDGQIAENAVWSYETPYPAMAEIAGRIAFYPDKVEVYETDEAAVNPGRGEVDVDQVVLHTDSGSGHAQREPWPTNVSVPDPDGGVR